MIKTNKAIVSGFLLLAAACASTGAVAHHGVNSQFDVSKDVRVSGVVTDIRLVNPHAYVYFDVTNTEGSVEAWRCEMSGGSLLRRNGWTEEMLAPGTAITVDGHPARREEFGCVANTVGFADGRVVGLEDVLNEPVAKEAIVVEAKLDDGTPNLNGNWIALRREAGGGPGGAAPGRGERAAEGGVPGGTPAPAGGGRPGGRGLPIAQTEAGIAASAGFNREDNPRFHCRTTNIFLDWTFNEQVNNIVQTDDSITLNYGFMEMITRTIHLDMDSHPAYLVRSRIGHSIGKWEGDTLVVDTVGFAEGYLAATFNGVKHSDAMHVVERFSLSEDGNSLNRSYTANDPLYLSSTFEGNDTVVRTSYPFQAYDCEDLTEERAEGF